MSGRGLSSRACLVCMTWPIPAGKSTQQLQPSPIGFASAARTRVAPGSNALAPPSRVSLPAPHHGCANLAHGFAGAGADKDALRSKAWPNIAIVSAYNDMLSAHAPYERFPNADQGRRARGRRGRAVRRWRAGHVRWRHAGHGLDGTVAVQPRRHRHVHRRGAVAQHVRRRAAAGHLRQDRAGPVHRRHGLRPPAGDLRARRADDFGPAQSREIPHPQPVCRGQGRRATNCWPPSRPAITAPEPARSTAPPTATRC